MDFPANWSHKLGRLTVFLDFEPEGIEIVNCGHTACKSLPDKPIGSRRIAYLGSE